MDIIGDNLDHGALVDEKAWASFTNAKQRRDEILRCAMTLLQGRIATKDEAKEAVSTVVYLLEQIDAACPVPLPPAPVPHPAFRHGPGPIQPSAGGTHLRPMPTRKR